MTKHLQRGVWILCILLIAAQTVIAAWYTKAQPGGLNDLKDAAAVFYNGGFTAGSPVMSLWGLLGRLFHVEPLFLALHVLPFVLIPLCYAAYFFLILSLPAQNAHRPYMLLFLCILHLFGYQSDAFSVCTLLLCWYSGYALALHLLLPLLFAFLLRFLQKHPPEQKDANESVNEEDEEMKHKYLNTRNLGIALLVITLAMAAVFFVLNRKINNLHLATENLQRSILEKGDLIEFRGALGDEWKGYVIVGSDGGVNVFFGGSEDDGPALAEMLAKYGQVVDNWYLKKDEQGAYEYCRDQGIAVSHVFLLEGVEEVQ